MASGNPPAGSQFHFCGFIFYILAPSKRFSIYVIIHQSLFWNPSSSPEHKGASAASPLISLSHQVGNPGSQSLQIHVYIKNTN
ncbi:hypothetical protein IMY05_011G0045600 [Salix suchowensis]|nr:hypothetical protein IMY05_011G0045600 [Salix suchowensis]